ncbi:MAG TPA: prolyl oligopeptidase family serine peptidase [Xanthomonadaceae bacterium]|nr:prolyl oligopeptidase family serine peptidase [Xanthomonadaceae bacterium]
MPALRLQLAAVFGALTLAVWVGGAAAQPTQPLTLQQIMADPDWIGPPVEDAWWSWDGQHAHYLLKRTGSSVRDTFVQPVRGGTTARVDDAARGQIDAGKPVYDRAANRMAFVRGGDIFVRDLRSGALTQLTRSAAEEGQPQWGRDGGLVWRSGNDWFRWHGGGISQASQLKTEDDPAKPLKPDDLRDRQLRLIETLKADRARRDAAQEQARAWQRADASAAPLPAYLGADAEIRDSALSPDGRWLLVVTQAKGADAGQVGKMPKYVTESGYEEVEEVRTRVGRGTPVAQTLWLVDVPAASVRKIAFDTLPGINDDPIAALRKAAARDALKGVRDVRVETDGDRSGPAIHWRDDGQAVAVLVRAVDNKDRWIATLDLDADAASAKLRPRHRLHDDAWVSWEFNEFGWLPDGRLWLLSEESGWSHLYAGTAALRPLTSGKWEVSSPQPARDGEGFYFLCNRAAPGDYEVCTVDADGGAVREITALDGVEGFELSPKGDALLVRHSDSYVPAQLATVDTRTGATVPLTDTRTPAFKAIDWIEPQIVQVPSKHGAGPIAGKFYGPRVREPGRRYPLVMFVHGAGYLQNVHDRYPNYYREQMFHNLLVQRGYIVLDLDYRASRGYGRDWRTAIYRQMGTPELQDYLDGLDWLVAERQGDRARAGIYGGSYGGFLTFMVLFKQPGVFKAGAALRPVSDWSSYNHEYTSNILNTPELDPEAYRKSSPIEFAAGLRDHLLIAHGMIDDNVFYRDSVLLAQRLIELRKDKWELASYPLEGHGFTHPESWYDEYRRILELFDRVLQPAAR